MVANSERSERYERSERPTISNLNASRLVKVDTQTRATTKHTMRGDITRTIYLRRWPACFYCEATFETHDERCDHMRACLMSPSSRKSGLSGRQQSTNPDVFSIRDPSF